MIENFTQGKGNISLADRQVWYITQSLDRDILQWTEGLDHSVTTHPSPWRLFGPRPYYTVPCQTAHIDKRKPAVFSEVVKPGNISVDRSLELSVEQPLVNFIAITDNTVLEL